MGGWVGRSMTCHPASREGHGPRSVERRRFNQSIVCPKTYPPEVRAAALVVHEPLAPAARLGQGAKRVGFEQEGDRLDELQWEGRAQPEKLRRDGQHPRLWLCGRVCVCCGMGLGAWRQVERWCRRACGAVAGSQRKFRHLAQALPLEASPLAHHIVADSLKKILKKQARCQNAAPRVAAAALDAASQARLELIVTADRWGGAAPSI